MNTNKLKEIIADKNLIGGCGLYCGACRSYLSGKCPGCRANTKASWCKIRICCIGNNWMSCAECTDLELKDCRKYHSFFSKLIGVVLDSDRSACISRIRLIGPDDFASEMAAARRHTISRK